MTSLKELIEKALDTEKHVFSFWTIESGHPRVRARGFTPVEQHEVVSDGGCCLAGLSSSGFPPLLFTETKQVTDD